MIINEPNNTVNTTIRKYNRLKIYQVDAIDGQLKKFTPKTANEQGCLKIYLNEKLNQIYFTIYAVNDPVKNKQIYDHMSLNEIDLDLVEAAVTRSSRKVIRFGGERDANKNGTGDVEDRKRVEFRKRDRKTVNNDTLVYHAVEFNSSEALDDLANTLSYLAEAYLVKEAESDDRSEAAADSPVVEAKDSKGSIDDNDANLDESAEIVERKKDANEMIKDLQESIRRGDVKFAMYWARMLARISAKIEISLENEGNNEVTDERDPAKKDADVDRNNNKNNETKRKVNVTWKKSYDDENDQDHIHIELELDVATTKVGELKLIVEDRLGLTVQKQLMIINDCSTASDQDLVNLYEPFSKRKIKEKRSEDGRASASVAAQVSDDSEPYEVFVIIKDDETDETGNNSPQSNKKPVRKKTFSLKIFRYI